MIIFGYRQTMRELGTLVMRCRHCGMQGWHRIYRLISWFTLFFVPVLPVWVSRVAFCGTCGLKAKLSKAEADALLPRA